MLVCIFAAAAAAAAAFYTVVACSEKRAQITSAFCVLRDYELFLCVLRDYERFLCASWSLKCCVFNLVAVRFQCF